METEIKIWYMQEYKDDECGNDIYSGISFQGLLNMLIMNLPIQDIGITDSIVRERLFLRLTGIMNIHYDYIYKLWLRGI